MTDLGGEGRRGGQVRPCDFKFLTADYPPNKAPIATKLWENAFQTIPVISFFDPKNVKTKKMQNFERPFTPQGWLRSASNFGKTRFR